MSHQSQLSKGSAAREVSPIWLELAAKVRRFKPDVCVLVARKMPRLIESLKLDLGNCLIISDLAIPFAHQYLNGARVAIVDDLVNVGSTLNHTYSCAAASGALEIRSFAIGARVLAGRVSQGTEYVFPDPLSEQSYAAIVADVPTLLMELAKPYDLEFPIIPCRYVPPIRSAAQLLSKLRDRLPEERLHDLGVHGASNHLRRITIDFPSAHGSNLKLRLYCDDQSHTCNITPFVIPWDLDSLFTGEATQFQRTFVESVVSNLTSMPDNLLLWPREAELRVRLFALSWEYGLKKLGDFADLLALNSTDEVSVPDIELLFGPVASEAVRQTFELTSLDEIEVLPSGCHEMADFRFLRTMEQKAGHRFADVVRERAGSNHEMALFRAIFSIIADLVGAENPDNYNLSWPFEQESVKAKPILRLKVGPTYPELLEFMRLLLNEPDSESIRGLVSTLLDMSIDSGEVVPTISRYEGKFVRIYRKGENKGRDEAMNRLLAALTHYGKPLSLTRIAKLTAILSYSSLFKDIVWASAVQRGNVASLRKTAMDLDSPVLAEYMRNIGEIKQID